MFTTALIVLSIMWLVMFVYYIINTTNETTTAAIVGIGVAYFAGCGVADFILKAATWIAQL